MSRLVITKERILAALHATDSQIAAAHVLDIHPSQLYRLRKRYQIPAPESWKIKRLECLAKAWKHVPMPVIRTKGDRRFVGTMIGTEGSISCSYDAEELDTALVIIVEMTDREWVARFAEAIRVSPPRDKGQAILLPNRRPKFRRGASGLRALRILVEVMPYLYGQKLLEAKRAVEYFSPTGYTEGCHRAAEIWGGIR
ncbi:MAG: helix-turn-helix domain-containing protein [Thaumarchaeota archaeon]|nr:hypothetical protein [Nitrososphaerota archaeon]MCS4540115.1 helix-turn-helix domain-containing protein [Nitrososphaerota archaeon]